MNKDCLMSLTAAHALTRVSEWEDLSKARRSCLGSAVNLLCRIGGPRHPATVRLDPDECLPAIDGASAVALGLTIKSHQNYRAGLRYVLRRLGLLAPVRERDPVSDPAWTVLVDALPARFHPHRLRAFMEYCGTQGIPPAAVTSATLETYLEERQATRGGTNVRTDVKEVARQWNKMRREIPDWPQVDLALGTPEGRVQTLPFSAYSTGVQTDIENYLAWLARSPEDTTGPDDEFREPASPATVEGYKKGVRLLLWGLVETGSASETLGSLNDLVSFDLAHRTLRWHRNRLGHPDPKRPARILPTAGTRHLADTVNSLAAYCRVKDEPAEKLRRMLATHRPKKQREITEKLAVLLDRLADPDVEPRLLHLPVLLLRKAQRTKDGWTSKSGNNHPPDPRLAAWYAAIAVAIEIELHLPLRLHDLTRLRIHEHLVVTAGRGRQPREVRLRVAASKNGRIVETCLIGEPASTMLTYLEEFRPHGPHPTTAWLFPNRGREDRPRSKNGFSERIATAIEKYAGVRVNVHAFRAYAATVILRDRRHAIEDVRAILGHSDFEAAERHYRQTNRAAASQHLGELIRKRRRGAKLTSTVASLPLDLDNETRRARS